MNGEESTVVEDKIVNDTKPEKNRYQIQTQNAKNQNARTRKKGWSLVKSRRETSH